MFRWSDHIELLVYISTSGDFVSLGTRTEYPFQSGGPTGIPAGWTRYDSGSAQSDVNMSVGYGRYNISNTGTVSHAGWFYGAYRDFPIKPDKRYLFQVQARQMEGKSNANRNVRYEKRPSVVGSGSYSLSYTDWENISIYAGASGTDTTLRIVLQAIYYIPVGMTEQLDWGIQFQNLAIIEQDNTYPDPTWEQVTCDVKGYSMRYGRDRFTARYDVGSLQLSVINNDGSYTYQPNSTLRPGRFLKIVARDRATGNEIAQYYGIIDSLNDSYSLDGRVLTNLSCVDISSLLSNTTVPTAQWADSTSYSGDRFVALLNAVGWHPSMRTADRGVFIQQAIMANGRTVRDELGLIADSEGSYFIANRTGKLEYHDRNWPGYHTEVRAELLARAEPEPDLIPDVTITLPGVTGNYLQIGTQPSLTVTDLEIVCRLSLAQVVGVRQAIVGRYESGSNYSFLLLKRTGDTGFDLWAAGAAKASAAFPITNGQRFWLKAQRITATGEVNFYYAPDQETEPTDAAFTKIGNTQVYNIGVPVTDTSLPFLVGATGPSGSSYPMMGEIYRVIIRDGVQGALRVDISDDDVFGMAGSTAFTADSGQTVTVHQTGSNVILADDSYYVPGTLPPVDNIPTVDDPYVICTRELNTTFSRDRVVNEVSVANQGGAAMVVIDAPSQRKYGPQTYERMDLLNVNTDPTYLSTRVSDLMTGYADAVVRVNSIVFRPTDRSYLWALDVFLNEMVRVRYDHPSLTWGYSVVARVQGLEHTLTLDDWVISLNLDQPVAFRWWDTETIVSNGWDWGLWDQNRWDEGIGTHWSTDAKWSDPLSNWEA